MIPRQKLVSSPLFITRIYISITHGITAFLILLRSSYRHLLSKIPKTNSAISRRPTISSLICCSLSMVRFPITKIRRKRNKNTGKTKLEKALFPMFPITLLASIQLKSIRDKAFKIWVRSFITTITREIIM